MSKNIIFVLDFIINSDNRSTDLFFVSLFSWNGMSTKDCGWLKVAEDTSHASFNFSWMKDAKRRLSSKDPSDWDGLQRRLMTWQPRYAAFVGCSLPFEKHPLFSLIILETFLQLDWSPPVVNSVDWTWFGKAHTCLYNVPQLIVLVRAQTKPWSPRNCL